MRTLKLLAALTVFAAAAACGSPDDDGAAVDTLVPPPTGEVQDPPPPGASTSTSDVASSGPNPSTSTTTTVPLSAPAPGIPGRSSTSASTGPTGTTQAGSTTETAGATGTTGEVQTSTTIREGATTQPSGPTATTSPSATTTTPPKKAQTISFGQPPGPWAYDERKVIAASASSGLPVAYAATGACVVEDPLLGVFRATDVGACRITASQNGDGAWKAATPETLSTTISKAKPVIAFSGQEREYPQDYFSLALTATSYPGAVIEYELAKGTGICTVTGATLEVTIDPNGPPSLPYTCDVTALVEASQHFESGSAIAHFKINPTVLTIKGNAKLIDAETVQVDVTLNHDWDITVTADCGSPEDQYDDYVYSFTFVTNRVVDTAARCTITIVTVTRDQAHEDATLTLTVP